MNFFESEAILDDAADVADVDFHVPSTLSELRLEQSAPTRNRYLESWSKRGLDVTLASLLLVFILPLLIGVALLIRANSAGPAIFRQARNGIGLRPFMIFKLRSMYVEPVEAGYLRQASRNDPRVTPVGRFLRRFSIDELPQLLNVLRGDMSLVGPRPHALAHDAFYSKRMRAYDGRFRARPGITGLAQASGARGETRTLADMQRRVDLDNAYIENASLLLDLKILGVTAVQLLTCDQAY